LLLAELLLYDARGWSWSSGDTLELRLWDFHVSECVNRWSGAWRVPPQRGLRNTLKPQETQGRTEIVR
jgi:hypothetical protein